MTSIRGIVLPKWMTNRIQPRYNSIMVALVYALSLHHHGTAEKIREVSRTMRTRVCLEHQPKLKAFANITDDTRVVKYAKELVENVTDALDILPGQPFPIRLPPPVCCEQPMKLAGYHQHRHWKCNVCKESQPLRENEVC